MKTYINFTRINYWIIVICLLAFMVGVFKTYYDNNKMPTLTEPVSTGIFPVKPTWIYNVSTKLRCDLKSLPSTALIGTIDNLVLLDPRTGIELFNIELATEYTDCPQSWNQWLFIPISNNEIIAYNIFTKSELKFDYPQLEYPESNISNMIFDGENLIVLRYNRQLTSYNINLGKDIWTVSVPYKFMDMEFNENTLYLGAEKKLFAYQLETGKLIWQFDFSEFIGKIKFIDHSLLLIESNSREDIFLEFDLRKQIVSNELFLKGINNVNQIFDVEGRLYILGDNLVVLNKETKRILWDIKTDAEFNCIAFSSKNVFVLNRNNVLYQLDKSSGKLLGTLTINPQPSCPTTIDNVLVIPFDFNKVLGYLLE